jgi:predicted PurR-regulated permease PerM
MQKPKVIFSQSLAFSLISIGIIVYGLWLLQDLLIPLVFSGLLAIILLPMTSWLEKYRFPRVLAISLSIIFLIVVFFLLFYLAYTQIASFEEIIPELTTKGEKFFAQLQTYIRDNFNIGRKKQLVEGQKYLTEILKNNGDTISNIFGTTTSFLGNLALVPLYVFLLLLYRDFFKKFLYKLFKSTSKHRIDLILWKIKEVVLSYIAGLLIVIAIIGTCNTIGLLVIGIDYAVFFGFFAAFLCIVPYIGIFLGAILPILMALITKDSYWYAVAVAGLFGTVQMLEGNLITPYIVGSKVSVNSLAAMLSLIVFGNLWGVAGLVLAIPITAIIKVVFDHVEGLKPYGFLLGDTEG